MIHKTIIVDGQTFRVSLASTGEIQFSYKVPEPESSWMWDSYDQSDQRQSEAWTVLYSGVGVSPFRLKQPIISAVAECVKRSKRNMFYFTPTSTQRGRVYARLTDELVTALGGNWDVQNVDNTWFYFTRRSA